MNLKQEIAKQFEASGLFHSHVNFPNYLGGVGLFNRRGRLFYSGYGPYLTADESEEILAHMGLQVVKIKKLWWLIHFEDNGPNVVVSPHIELCDSSEPLTLALNLGVGHQLKYKRKQLETALKELGKL